MNDLDDITFSLVWIRPRAFNKGYVEVKVFAETVHIGRILFLCSSTRSESSMWAVRKKGNESLNEL